jgi:TolB-like protein
MNNKVTLNSWKAISDYLGREIRTCYRWEKELGLPVYRIDKDSRRSKIFSYKSEIDEWLKNRTKSKVDKKKSQWGIKPLIIGLISGTILLSFIIALLYFSHRISFSTFSENLSIAVLPFENRGTLEYDEYFSEGLTYEIIDSLSRINRLKVLPVFSLSNYNSSIKNAKQIVKEVEADYILKGSIKKDENKFNLFVQFIRAKDNANIWSAEFEEPLDNILSIQNKICLKISDILNLNTAQKIPPSFNKGKSQNRLAFDNYLKGNYILKRLIEDSNDPWKLYHQGKYYWGQCTQESNELAIYLFNQAIEMDGKFALAYIGLAHCYANYVNFNWEFDVNWLNKAENLLQKAQTIYPDLPEYYSALIEIYLMKEIGFNENTRNIAFGLAQEGIKKYPNHAQLNSIVGYCYYLKFAEEGNQADFNKALEYKEKSFWLDPYKIDNIVYAELLILKKEFYKAMDVCNLIKNNDPSSLVYSRLGEIYYYLGDLGESEAIFQKINAPLDLKIHSLFYIGMIASQKGGEKETQEILHEIDIISPGENKFFEHHLRLASIYMGLGKKELGYKHLESFFENPIAKKNRFIYQKYIDIDRNFDNFRDKEQFKKILRNREKTYGQEQNN